ncbi:WGR domain-containing protein [Aerosakkonema sp. BLCC-F183]|uniref:WGR domain-containing protein n=1 Tax=Aerosakkonema sp. BLCC-F183 TaxID=3342834 RepID=UPI0035B6AD2D
MQLIKRTTLHYQEGSSDKVYEVDLCQVGENRYTVNFRYGRRGANLKEGVKTEQAVPLAQAQKIFDKLVAEKVNKGYRDVSIAPASQTTAPKAVRQKNPDARNQAILNRLADRNQNKWPLERAIWRAGELKIRAATPLLLPLLGTGDALRDYCIVWALGWCGDMEVTPTLQRIYKDSNKPDFVRRIAWEVLFKFADAATKTTMRAEKIGQLPSELRELAKNGTAEAFANALRGYLEYRTNQQVTGFYSQDYQRFAVLDLIYQIDNEFVRPVLLEILQNVRFLPNTFQRIRHIFKMAEYRHDAEVFGILTYRFEKEKPNYRSNRYWVRLPDGNYLSSNTRTYNPQTRQYESLGNQIEEELKRPNCRIAYNDKTQGYLRRRTWKTLKQLGEEGDINYVKMAVGVLLQYSNADAQPVRENTIYRYDRTNNWSPISFKRIWDGYAGYLTFNHILYENSPRYGLKENSKAWRCRNYKPGDAEPDVREEAFTELWEQQPDELLRLLLSSSCRPVHHFAVKALRACPQFCAELDVDTAIKLLNKLYEVTVRFGFEIARNLYNSAEPQRELVTAVVNCIVGEVRAEAYRWIEEGRDRFLSDINFITNLVTSDYADTRQFARRLLSSSVIGENAAKLLIARVITELLALSPNSDINPVHQDNIGEKVKDIAETLLTCFTAQLRTLGMSVIHDLLEHPQVEIQEFGARILLNHEIAAADLPPGLIDSLMNSPYESVRGVGIRIFGQLPDPTLLNQYSLLVTMLTHELADIRNAIRPVVRRLSADYPDFAARLATATIDMLMGSEAKEEVRVAIVRLLKEDLPGWMTGVTKDTALRLLKAKSSATQELAGYVLSANRDKWANDFETIEIVRLADNEILSVREAAREMFLHNLNRLRGNEEEMLSAVRIVECKWEDSREFGFRLFNTFFTADDLTPNVLVSLCDSVREDVRTFGRNLVIRYFNESYGQEYMLKFSEHPTTDMQMFATNYLENYAVNNPERLQELKPYFITVLSRVNKSRVAKQRIFTFLDKEAQKTEEAARVVAEILTRQSVTMAIGDKAMAIQSMVKIKKTYPHLDLPIQVKPISEIRR